MQLTMNAANWQDQQELAFLQIMTSYPEKIGLVKDENIFSNETLRKLFLLMRKHWDGETLNLDGMAYEDEGLFDYFLQIWDWTPYVSMFDHWLKELTKKYFNRILSDKLLEVQAGSLSQDEYVNLVNRASARLKEETTNDDYDFAEAVTSSDDTLKFNKFAKLLQYVRIPLHTLTTIAAYTSRGKSALALNLGLDLMYDYKIMYFNLEMARKAVDRRICSIQLDLPSSEFYGLKRDCELYNDIVAVGRNLKEKEFTVYTGARGVDSICDIVEKESKVSKKPIVVIVDHVNYLTPIPNVSERENISYSMKRLNAIAKNEYATVFVLSQINRMGEDNANLSNLQGSAAIEQDSDTVLILEYQKGADLNQLKVPMVLNAKKVRSGMTGALNLMFNKPTQTFYEVD
jgi:replicative DNA helicase